MDASRFDRLTRRFADISVPLASSTEGVSRRAVLRGAAAGAIGAAASVSAPRPVAAELCPQRVPRRNYEPTVNGCGPSGYGWVIPDSFGSADFTLACNRHDRCYGTCNESRMKCDYLLRESMQHACRQAFGGGNKAKLRKCFGRAKLYFNVVSEDGLSAFEDAQREACRCCRAPATKCGDSCCNTSQCMSCRGGSCRSKCGRNQTCSGGVCKKIPDCGRWGCGG